MLKQGSELRGTNMGNIFLGGTKLFQVSRGKSHIVQLFWFIQHLRKPYDAYQILFKKEIFQI